MGSDRQPPASIGVDTQELIADRYRLLRKIGSGGMATVWLAEDDRLDRRVAIKRLHTSAPEDAARRLVREARLGAGLSDPHLVTIYDALPAADGVLIVMELVDGVDLDQELRGGALDSSRTIQILRAVAQALDHAHERQVVHRDVKPSNILLGVGETVKLTDLGIAKALEDTGFTASGMILGSVPYMSPEQLLGEPIGTASDIYSLGLIAYECLSGVRARQETGAPQAAHRVMNEPPPDIRDDRRGSSSAVSAVLGSALERDPTRRPGSAGAFVRDLADVLESEAGEPAAEITTGSAGFGIRRYASTAGTHRLPKRLAAGGAIALVIAAILVGILNSGGGSAGTNRATGDRPASSSAGGDPAAAANSKQPGTPVSSASSSSSSPVEAVRSFYELAAAGDTRSAWRLAAPSFRSQLAGYSAFKAQQSTLRRIDFRSLKATAESSGSASVSFATTATHTDRTDRCQGSANLTSAGGEWRISGLADVSCQPG
ncbi:hypothetical protein BH10ACT11_BH10ACT11_02560 [soil metagenome]